MRYTAFEKLERTFSRQRRRGFYFFTSDKDKKSLRRIARMCERVYQRSITNTHTARRVDRRFGEIEEDDTGRSGRKYFATDIKTSVIGRIIWC